LVDPVKAGGCPCWPLGGCSAIGRAKAPQTLDRGLTFCPTRKRDFVSRCCYGNVNRLGSEGSGMSRNYAAT
jgi:hypothetical protein